MRSFILLLIFSLSGCGVTGGYDRANDIQIWKYLDGDRYEGPFRGTGSGKYYFSNGDEYVGEFKDGNLTGKGKLTYKDGKPPLIGYFNKGVLVQPFTNEQIEIHAKSINGYLKLRNYLEKNIVDLNFISPANMDGCRINTQIYSRRSNFDIVIAKNYYFKGDFIAKVIADKSGSHNYAVAYSSASGKVAMFLQTVVVNHTGGSKEHSTGLFTFATLAEAKEYEIIIQDIIRGCNL